MSAVMPIQSGRPAPAEVDCKVDCSLQAYTAAHSLPPAPSSHSIHCAIPLPITPSRHVRGRTRLGAAARRGQYIFTPPLIGSELWYDQSMRLQDGLSQFAIGVQFTTTIHERDIEARVKAAVIRLRFECPLVAATIERGIHHPDFGSWVYAPLATPDAARAWADQAVHYLPDPVEPSSFLQSTVETNKIPYVLADGSAQYLRFYLTRPSSTLNSYCLLLHTAHCTTDAKPALNALSLLLEWMTGPEPESELGDLAWGTEHQNLPAGPVTATGGPREDWGTNGMALVQKFQEIFGDQTPSHGLEYDASTDRLPGKAHRFHTGFTAQESAKIAQALKSLGFTFSELLDAASIVAGFEQTPIPADKVASAHVKGAYLIALTDRLAPSVDRRKHLVSALAFAPYRVDYAPLAPLAGRARLLAALRQVKDQYDWSLANPCLPLLVATLGPHIVPTTEASTAPISAYAPMMANVGRVEDYVAPVWPKDQDQDKGGEGEGAAIRVEDTHMACRMGKAWFQP